MAERYTAAHWGVYRVLGEGENIALAPAPGDERPSLIGTGWLAAARDKGTRIARPAVRSGWLERRDRDRSGRDAFVEVSWDEALDLAAGELKRVIRAQGNRAIFGGSYGWASAGRFHHAQSQLKRFLNLIGGFVSSVDTYSYAVAEVLLPHIAGLSIRDLLDETTSWDHLEGHTELLVAFGGISGRTAQVSSSGTSNHEVEGQLVRLRRAGARIVNISPRRADVAAELGAEWIAVRPNTDAALIFGLAHTLIEEGFVDRAFLNRCTVGWPKLEAYITGASDGRPKSAAWAAEISGVEAERIRLLARDMAASRTMISLAWSLQRADHGEQPLWMGLALAAMLGELGTPGGGFGFGYGSITQVGRSLRPSSWPSLRQGRNPIAQFIPVGRIADMLLEPGGRFTYNGRNLIYPDIKLIYWAGGNPFHHHQDLNRLAQAWRRPETIIVNDIWWTATARRADIVLPVTSPLERTDIMANRFDSALVFMDKAMEPYEQARDDHDVFCGLAERFGARQAFAEGLDKEDWLRRLWSEAVVMGARSGLALPDFDAFRTVGRFDRPPTKGGAVLFRDFVRDPERTPLKTPSGRIELFSEFIAAQGLADCRGHPMWIEPAERLGAPGAKGRLHLVSGQPLTRLHSQLDNGPASRATKIAGRETVFLHPQTARRHQVADGDVVKLSNARGACLAAVVVSDDIGPDVAWMATGAWFDPQDVDGDWIDVHGNPNSLTFDKGASGLTQAPSALTTLVSVEKWTKPLPPLTIDRPPPFVEAPSAWIGSNEEWPP
jgi:biotin/methionine sulfoxide reductase